MQKPEKEFPVNLMDWKHVFSSPTSYRIRNPNHYQKPGWVYQDEQKYRHRDFAGRVCFKPLSDRYLHHHDGYLRNLIVQCTDDLFSAPSNSTWRRTYVRKVSPLKVRLATWVIDFSYDPESWEDWWIMFLRALPAAIAMTLVFWDGSSMRPLDFRGWYAPVPYMYHGDAKVWSNYLENRKGLSLLAKNHQVYNLLKPRHLCFLRSPYDEAPHGVDVRAVAEWEASAEGYDANLSYLFVAYSSEHFNHGSESDMKALHEIAEKACRDAKLPAYWVAASCMRDERELEADVYRISDILRGAQKMIIAVGQGNNSMVKADTDALLRHWGSRMWTFPEVLLSPGRSIAVYTHGGNLNAPLVVSKNQFAARVWATSDADVSRQLTDHYVGNLSLSRLELAVLALKCLYSRQTTTYLDGDQAYALMGLLRLRPQIDRTDSQFQAFARLSLANDSDMLLERYICTLPLSRTQPWYDMEDAYQSHLWDITPSCQVAAICANDTVVLDGAYGASIRWKSFYPIYFSTGPSWKRYLAYLLMEYQLFFLVLAAVLFTYGALIPALIFPGIVFLALWLYFWVMTPKLVRIIHGGKFTEVQAALFGFEGYLNAATIERALFGGCFGRLGWSVNGSPLSRSYVNEFGERVSMDPTKDVEVRARVEQAKSAKPGDMRVFTLVDTYNMEMTLFEAVRPPSCVFICGAEGGMQRAVGCSYDWTSQTMYRETVLRMPTMSLNRMDRVPRFRFGISRPDLPVRPASATSV
ncbi:hypothetical protein B0T17DRAFT_587350 [Bombardia bombarda]|uniref:Uncharacterized protein n=1 Tax=Bombardia bombarda TaxID=252184 RepID=A0AA40CF76_9PEZI|nr:hypothetical protein B0T17DRAFT_587350 [Bombardia bombarda]